MNIAFAMFCRRKGWSIWLPMLVALISLDTALWVALALSLIYNFTSKSLVLSNLLFYAITNFGCWLLWYPQTWEGLALCYIKALPFLLLAFVMSAIFLKVFALVSDSLPKGFHENAAKGS